MYADAVLQLAEDADSGSAVSQRARYIAQKLYRDIYKTSSRDGTKVVKASTAWHRASSRFETYVDLGWLSKGTDSREEQYKYIYQPTVKLQALAESLSSASDGREWLEGDMFHVQMSAERLEEREGDSERMRTWLARTAKSMERAVPLFPIDALVVGLASHAALHGLSISPRQGRDYLARLSAEYPDLVRLSRGSSGERAEFVSLDLGKLANGQ